MRLLLTIPSHAAMTVKTALALHEVFTCQQSTDKVFTFTAGILPIPIAKSVESLRKESEREEDVYPARYFLFLFDWGTMFDNFLWKSSQ